MPGHANATSDGMMTACTMTNIPTAHPTLAAQSLSDHISPELAAGKTVYVEVRNASGKRGFPIEQPLDTAIVAHGYQIATHSGAAKLTLQVNILHVQKGALAAGPQRTLDEAVGGLGAKGVTGVMGGVADFMDSAAAKGVTFTVVADVQVSERTNATAHAASDQSSAAGSSGAVHLSHDATSHATPYRVRFVCSATKVGLAWAEAQPTLIHTLGRAISDVF